MSAERGHRFSGAPTGCTFCGEPGDYVEPGLYCCGAPQCDRELSAELRERDEAAREAAERDGFERYR